MIERLSPTLLHETYSNDYYIIKKASSKNYIACAGCAFDHLNCSKLEYCPSDDYTSIWVKISPMEAMLILYG